MRVKSKIVHVVLGSDAYSCWLGIFPPLNSSICRTRA